MARGEVKPDGNIHVWRFQRLSCRLVVYGVGEGAKFYLTNDSESDASPDGNPDDINEALDTLSGSYVTLHEVPGPIVLLDALYKGVDQLPYPLSVIFHKEILPLLLILEGLTSGQTQNNRPQTAQDFFFCNA